MAWLLLIIFFPYVGVPMYLIFGGRKMRRKASRKSAIGLEQVPESAVTDELNPVEHLLRTYGIPAAGSGNKIELCPTGQSTYQNIVALIESACESIYISTYIYSTDDIGRDILHRLAAKASQGVRVRVLVDDFGSLYTKRTFFAELTEAGGQVSYFMPVFHIPFRGRTNLRNHRKILLVDGRKVLAGGTNIAKEYIGPSPQPGRWQDFSFVLQGPAVGYFLRIFASDWEFASGEKLPVERRDTSVDFGDGQGDIVQVVPSGPDVPSDALYDSLLYAIYTSQKRLWIVTQYFVPDESSFSV